MLPLDPLLSKLNPTWPNPAVLGLFLGLLTLSPYEDTAFANPVSLDGTTPGSVLTGASDCSSDCTIRSATPITGDYLLHSFQDFNVNPGVAVTFTSRGIMNTLVRVTGGNPSDIRGRLRLVRGQNLFLLNPNGIHFYDGAVLDLSGSFAASTAESLQFRDPLFLPSAPFVVTEYSATDNTSVFPLSIFSNITGISGLRFNSNPGEIRVQDVQFQDGGDPGIGHTLGFLGGRVAFDRTRWQLGNNWHLRLVGIGGADILPISLTPDGLSFDGNSTNAFAEIELQNSEIDLGSGFGIPVFQARGQSITLTHSQLRTLVSTGSGQPVELKVEDGIILDNSVIQSEVLGSFVGNDISLQASDISLSNASVIQAIAQQNAIGGKLILNLTEDLRLISNSVLRTVADNDAQGGDIDIQSAHNVFLNSSEIQATARENAIGGNLLIRTSDDLRIRDNSVLRTVANQNAQGGNIQLNIKVVP